MSNAIKYEEYEEQIDKIINGVSLYPIEVPAKLSVVLSMIHIFKYDVVVYGGGR